MIGSKCLSAGFMSKFNDESESGFDSADSGAVNTTRIFGVVGAQPDVDISQTNWHR